MPEITLKNINKIKLESPVLKVKKEDLEKSVGKIAEQYKDWDVVDREAKVGDKIKADLGQIDLAIENQSFVIGVNRVGKDQNGLAYCGDSKLVNALGEEKKLNIIFPDDYQDKKLASKPVNFVISVKEVMQSKISEINEDFIKKIGQWNENSSRAL